MRTHQVAAVLMLSASCALAADVTVEWKAGEKPESLGDGAVSLTYDEDAVSALAVAPSDGGTVTMTGDPIPMGADAAVTFAAPGTMDFANEVEAEGGNLTLGNPSDGPGTIRFVTGGSESSTNALSTAEESPTLIAEGVSLADYEPAYAHFLTYNPGGQKWKVAREHENEILRPYNEVRTDGSLTVQFQGVTRSHADPHTASITVRFLQQGDDIVAYIVRAAALKPLDIELGLDLDAMVDAGDERAVEKVIGVNNTDNYNLSVIMLRRVSSGTTVRFSSPMTTVKFGGYLPDDTWQVVAENCDLSDLQRVEGVFHYNQSSKYYNVDQVAFNLKDSTEYPGEKTCQFQRAFSGYVGALVVEFRQKGANVEAKTGKYRSYNIPTAGYEKDIVLGVDFELYNKTTTPARAVYGTYSTTDEGKSQGVKDLRFVFGRNDAMNLDLKGTSVQFRTSDRGGTIGGTLDGVGDIGVLDGGEGVVVTHADYLPNGSWVTVAEDRNLRDLVDVVGTFHYSQSGIKNVEQTPYNFKWSNGRWSTPDGGNGLTSTRSFQFQRETSSFIACLTVHLRQNGRNVEAYTDQYRSVYVYSSKDGKTYEEVKLGMDFENYTISTVPKREVYNTLATDDTSMSQGVKGLRLTFASHGIKFAQTCVSAAAKGLTFAGAPETPLRAVTTADTLFPSNGIVTVGPYADLQLVKYPQSLNGRWTEYRVMTNGTLRLKGTWQLNRNDRIDILGGEVKARDEELDQKMSYAYFNAVVFRDGARLSGVPVMVLNDSTYANWIVDGATPSFCDSGLVIAARGGSNEATFHFYVNDVTKDAATDFYFTGPIVDYNTVTGEDGYWNAHIVKGGEGTMELNGTVTLFNEITVAAGTLRLTGSDLFKVSRHAQDVGTGAKGGLALSGGTIEMGAGTVNGIGAFTVTDAPSALKLGEGARLSVSALDVSGDGMLAITAADGATVHVDSELTSATRRRIRLNGERVLRGEDGNLVPGSLGCMIILR